MSDASKKYLKFGGAMTIIVLTLAYLAYLGAKESKSYYVTIKELHAMGDSAYSKNLRVSGFVQPGTIKTNGSHANFTMIENGETVRVVYNGMEPPPDTFKDNSQALAIGGYKRDGVFYATELQTKCASHYDPKQQQPGAPGAAPGQQPAAAQPQAKGY